METAVPGVEQPLPNPLATCASKAGFAATARKLAA